jgi:hypothetical protein
MSDFNPNISPRGIEPTSFTIPELLTFVGLNPVYLPQAATALNRLLNTTSEIEYQIALKEATETILQVDLGNEKEFDLTGVSANRSFPNFPNLYLPLVLSTGGDGANTVLLESAVISLSRPKNVVVTAVSGRNGTVKEFINAADWEISVQGFLAQKTVGYPFDKVSELNALLEADTVLFVENDVLNNLGIVQIAVTDYKFPKSPFVNVQVYEFTALSDEPIEITLNEEAD